MLRKMKSLLPVESLVASSKVQKIQVGISCESGKV